MWRFLVALSAIVAVCCASAAPPELRWAQTKDKVFVTVVNVAQCAQPEFGRDTLVLDCGKNGKVDVILRNDIKPQESRCAARGRSTECTLVKAHEYHLDRLLFDDAYKGKVAIDWERYNEADDDSSEGDSEGLYEGNEEVRRLDQASLDEARQKYDFIVLDVAFPSCTKCSFHRQPFASAAKNVKSDKVLFGFVDAQEQRELRHKFDAKCDFECRLYAIDVKKDETTELRSSGTPEEIESLIKRHLKPVLQPVTSKDELTDVRGADKSVILAVMSSTDPNLARVRDFAAKNRKDFAVAISEDALGFEGVTAPALVSFRADQGFDVLPGAELSTNNLTSWALVHRFPPIAEYTWEERAGMEATGMPVALLYVEKNADPDLKGRAAQVYGDAPERFRGQLLFAVVSKDDFHYQLEEYGLKGVDGVAFGIASNASYANDKYGLEGVSNPTSEQIVAHVQDYVDGKLSPTMKSENVADGDAGAVAGFLKTSAKRLDSDVVGNDKDALVLAFSTWASLWEKSKPVYEKMARALAPVKNLALFTLDTNENLFQSDKLGDEPGQYIDKKAWLVLFTSAEDGGRKPVRYMGKTSRKDVLTWLKKHSGAVAAQFDDVKAAVDAMVEEAKREKEERKKKEAEANAELEAIPKVDISGDGGITKQIITEGSGGTPADGAHVTAHYTGRLLDGTVFDSSVERNQPFDFDLGKGNVIKCWDQGFATMKKGEKAYLTCQPEYAYGERDMGKIPANAVLRFEVELIDFTGSGKDEL